MFLQEMLHLFLTTNIEGFFFQLWHMGRLQLAHRKLSQANREITNNASTCWHTAPGGNIRSGSLERFKFGRKNFRLRLVLATLRTGQKMGLDKIIRYVSCFQFNCLKRIFLKIVFRHGIPAQMFSRLSWEDGRVLYPSRAPPLVCLSSILISWIFKGGFWMLGLPDYSPLNVVMLWLCSVAKNILPGFFFTFEVSTGLISHLSRVGTLCQRTDSARSFSPSNFALAPFLPWKLRLSLHTPPLDSAAKCHFCGYLR